jgi:hypothetical protein
MVAMKFEAWRLLTPDAVADMAIQLYRVAGGKNDLAEKKRVWRDESMAGKSVVYSVSHGYFLGSEQTGLNFRFIENWEAIRDSKRLVTTAVEIKSLDEPRLAVRYRHGKITAEIFASEELEKICRDILQIPP